MVEGMMFSGLDYQQMKYKGRPVMTWTVPVDHDLAPEALWASPPALAGPPTVPRFHDSLIQAHF
jgi:hypothetical protein